MSDPVNKPRQPVDLDEFERRLRGAEPAYQQQAYGNDPYAPPAASQQAAYGMAPEPQPQMPDPLAELARIVDGSTGQPYGTSRQGQAAADFGSQGDWGLRGSAGEPHPDLRGGYHGQDPMGGSGQAHDPYAAAPYDAQPAYGASWPNEDREWMDAPEALPPRRSRKKALLMGAALIVVAGGVVGTFAMRGGSTGRSDVPTIKAAQGPMKVTPEPAPASQEPSRTASVLERGNEKIGSSKVISNEEQPVDLSQVKASPAVPAAAPKSVFPEPIRVKTVSVRPDGTIVTTMPTPAPAPVAAPTPAPRQATASLPTSTTPAAAPPPAAAAATAARAPVPAPAAAPAPAPSQKMTERAVSPPLPVTPPAASADRRTASATPAATSPAPAPAAPVASGGYAVQFSAAGSENEAREKIAATQRRFGDALSGRVPSFVKGEAAGRTVWRVRVGGMSREEASSMCQRIKGQGGDCFVAAN